jgi:hypothetical protein
MPGWRKLARDNGISLSMAYDYRDEAISRCTTRCWRQHHGGNIRVVSAPDGWPLWTSGVRPAASTA